MHFAPWTLKQINYFLILCLVSKSYANDNDCWDPQGSFGICKEFQRCKRLENMLNANIEESGSLPAHIEHFFDSSRSACSHYNKKTNRTLTNATYCCRRKKEIISCGEKDLNRIAYGQDADVLEFPWMALLVFSDTVDPLMSSICCGSLVGERTILTAAHCARNKPISAILGEHDRSTEFDLMPSKTRRKYAPRPQEIKIQRTVLHPQYRADSGENDIAILILKRPADLKGGFVQLVCLPNKDSIMPKVMTTAGWGQIETKANAKKLQKVELKIETMSYCSDIMKKNIRNTICAHSANQSTCRGDSGGPLFGEIPKGKVMRFHQFGVLASGSWYCDGMFPSLFADVRLYTDWINKYLK